MHLHGEVACSQLALETIRRYQHFFSIYVMQDVHLYQFTQADKDSYVEGPTWVAFVSSVEENSATGIRCIQVRNIVPQNPPEG